MSRVIAAAAASRRSVASCSRESVSSVSCDGVITGPACPDPTIAPGSVAGITVTRIARLGVARTFQNLALFETMSVLDNVMVGAHGLGRSGFFEQALALPRAGREERAIAERGRYPAINVLKSVSRTMPHCNSEDENMLITEAKRYLSAYADMEEMIRLGAYRPGSKQHSKIEPDCITIEKL